MNEYYTFCIQPKASAKKYWTRNWLTGNRRYKQGAYRADINRYNKCLRQSKYGRARGEFEAGCKIGKKGEVDCSIQTGHTNPATVPGNVGQAGLGRDKGSALKSLEQFDSRILIGAAVVVLLLTR